MGFITYFFIWMALCALCAIGVFFIAPEKHTLYEFMALLGSFIWLGMIGWGISGLIQMYQQRKRKSKIRYNEHGYRIYEEPKANIIVEFVKAKYGKYCPKIDWK